MNYLEKIVANLSEQCTRKNVNSACMWVLYQGKIPKKAGKLKK